MKDHPRTRLLVWLVVPAVFAVYLTTLAPAVGLIDSGELAAGCHLLNIVHPTGYPLYTMRGRLASLVPAAALCPKTSRRMDSSRDRDRPPGDHS